MTNQTLRTETQPKRDFLWEQIRELPYFRGLLRAVEARFYQEIDLDRPVLDLGCGDGHFAASTFEQTLAVGLDPWAGPIREASTRGVYQLAVFGSGAKMPFPDLYFGSCISNSVLEHIPDLDPVLVEAARVLKPGALFVFCVPNHNFLKNLSISNFFDRIGMKFLGDAYRRFFNRISRHHHCDGPDVWEQRLKNAGFRMERSWNYFSPRAFHTLEWGHYFGLPSLVTHFLTRRWILVPTRWNLFLVRAFLQPCYDERLEQENGAYSFYIARKI